MEELGGGGVGERCDDSAAMRVRGADAGVELLLLLLLSAGRSGAVEGSMYVGREVGRYMYPTLRSSFRSFRALVVVVVLMCSGGVREA